LDNFFAARAGSATSGSGKISSEKQIFNLFVLSGQKFLLVGSKNSGPDPYLLGLEVVGVGYGF